MNKQQIARLVRAFTSGSMNIEHLRGPQMKYARVELLNHMRWYEYSSIGDLYAKLYDFYDIDGTCAAHMQLKLIEAMRDAMVDKNKDLPCCCDECEHFSGDGMNDCCQHPEFIDDGFNMNARSGRSRMNGCILGVVDKEVTE